MFPLDDATWEAIHEAMAEVHAVVGVPVTFLQRDTTQTVDPLYNEATAETAYVAYATLNASVRSGNRFGPDREYQTKEGLYAGDELLVWLPQGVIAAWEAGVGPPRTFAVDETFRLETGGARYQILGITNDRWGQDGFVPPGGSLATTRLGLLIRCKELPK